MNWIKDRLSEKSTYRGLTLVASACGLAVAPGAFEAIGTGAMALIGFIESVSSEW